MSVVKASYNFDGHKLAYHPGRVQEFLATGDCFPLYLEISPVGSCNHRCLFCAYDFIGYPDRKLDRERTVAFIKELGSCGVKSLLFAGEGEPLLHPDIILFVRTAFEAGIDLGMFTNGQLLSPELAAGLMPFMTFIRFSFNGGNRESYAAVHRTRPETFDKVIRNIGHAAALKADKGLKADIGAQFVAIAENITSLPAAARVLKDAGADYLAVKPFVRQSDRQAYRGVEPDPAALEEAFAGAEAEAAADFCVEVRRGSFAGYGTRSYCRCYGTSFISTVNSAGDVASCLPYWDRKEFVYGNIYEESFRAIWNGTRRREIKAHMEQCLDVKSCPPNCRPHAVNGFLDELKHPTVRHINFI